MAKTVVRDPSQSDLAAWNNEHADGHNILPLLATWAKLHGDVTDPRTPAGSLFFCMDALDGDGLTSSEDFAVLEPSAYDQILRGDGPTRWVYEDDQGEEVIPGIMQQAKARNLLHGARVFHGFAYTREQLAAQEAAEYDKWQMSRPPLTAPQNTSGGTGSSNDADMTEAVKILVKQRAEDVAKAGKDHVNLSEVVDPLKKRDVPIISADEYDECYDRFRKERGRPPFPHEKPSYAQITCVLDLIRAMCCYVDLGLMGPHDIRTRKFWCWKAKIMVNNFTKLSTEDVEIKGPPDFAAWEVCWTIYEACMIMVGAVSHVHLEAYHMMIKRLHGIFGPPCWGLLYQMEDRYRRERFTDLIRIHSEPAKAAKAHQSWSEAIHMDLDRPFQFIFRLCARGMGPEPDSTCFSEYMWWNRNFEGPAGEIKAGAPAHLFLGGDAPVARNSDEHIALTFVEEDAEAHPHKRCG